MVSVVEARLDSRVTAGSRNESRRKGVERLDRISIRLVLSCYLRVAKE